MHNFPFEFDSKKKRREIHTYKKEIRTHRIIGFQHSNLWFRHRIVCRNIFFSHDMPICVMVSVCVFVCEPRLRLKSHLKLNSKLHLRSANLHGRCIPNRRNYHMYFHIRSLQVKNAEMAGALIWYWCATIIEPTRSQPNEWICLYF